MGQAGKALGEECEQGEGGEVAFEEEGELSQSPGGGGQGDGGKENTERGESRGGSPWK